MGGGARHRAGAGVARSSPLGTRHGAACWPYNRRTMLLAPGAQLGPYRILGVLGGGGMGEVYKATDTRLGRTVAVKVLQGRLAESAAHRERFEREARLISHL